jgi:hypothetical protein
MTTHKIQPITYPPLKKRKKKDSLRKLTSTFPNTDVPTVKWSIFTVKFMVATCPKLDQIFWLYPLRDWSVKTNPDWMHPSNALPLVSSRVQAQKREDVCEPEWRCKHKTDFNVIQVFFVTVITPNSYKAITTRKKDSTKIQTCWATVSECWRHLHSKIAKTPIVIRRIYSDSPALELELHLNSPTTPSGTSPDILTPRDWWLWLSLLCMSLCFDCDPGGLWPPALPAPYLDLLY